MLNNMTGNYSVVGGENLKRKMNEQVIIVQVLVSLFLSINLMLLTTFFMKDYFYTTMRYILFANALMSDCMALIVTNLMLILSYFRMPVQIWLCLILYTLSSLYTFVTPVTLTAMALERCVAICMPFRHAELCSTRHALHCILVIHGLSSVPCIVLSSIFFASASLSKFKEYQVCTVQYISNHRWQHHVRSAISQLYFLCMFIIIVFSYVKIMIVARAASGENKKSTMKGLRTVVLHAFQLLLCLIQLLCPLIEAAAFKIDLKLFVSIRYFDYIMFNLIPRCLSPLIYGLRDEKFFLALKYYALCGLVKNKSLNFITDK